ncbi:ATP-dependent DNA helicase [Trichonephila clavipes]|nr:ATP-dependent DNA helicase [Trichonephila clavipes]
MPVLHSFDVQLFLTLLLLIEQALTITNETREQRELRLHDQSRRQALTIKNETQEQRETQLKDLRRRQALTIENETQEQRKAHQERQRIQHSQTLRRVNAQIAAFESAINTFCNRTCEICTKRCHPNQVTKCPLTETKTYLPNELKSKPLLLLCHRCKSHSNRNRDHSPPKAYWNNLNPGPIQIKLQEITQVEMRLPAKIKPFITIIKFDGLLGEYGFRAQAVLLTQDLHEVIEKLPNMFTKEWMQFVKNWN